jgi:hypothetical protein
MHHGLGDFKITNQQNKTKKQPLIGNHEFEFYFIYFILQCGQFLQNCLN